MLGVAEAKAGIVLMWAIWLSIVTVMNIIEALKAAKVLPDSVQASSNWALLLKVTAVYKAPLWLNWLLFLGVIVWEALGSGLLWAAFVSGSLELATTALIVCTALWGAFIVMNQLFLVFTSDGPIVATHRSLFGVFLLSLMAIRLL